MFEKPRCRCPRCVARRRNLCLVVSGVCAALAAGYLTVAERSDSSLEPIRGSATDFRADHTLRPRGNSGLISTGATELPAADRQQHKVVSDHQPEWSPRDEARREVSTRTVTVDGTSENIAIAYSSDPYGLLPKWLTENLVEVPRKPFDVPLEEGERIKQTLENAVVKQFGRFDRSLIRAEGRYP